jgi:hypothetical protein
MIKGARGQNGRLRRVKWPQAYAQMQTQTLSPGPDRAI